MTRDELEATASALKQVVAAARSLQKRAEAAEAGRPTAEAVKQAAARLVDLDVIAPAWRERAETAFQSHAETLDFLLNLAEDRAKLAAQVRDWPEMSPGTAVAASLSSSQQDEDAQWAADIAQLRQALVR